MPGHGDSGRATVALADDSPEIFNGKLAAAHVDERAHYGAHHVAQETVGRDDENISSVDARHGMPRGFRHMQKM